MATAFQNQQRAFEAALAGLEDAREQLRLARYNTALTVGNYNSQLAQAANGGTLVNSTRLLNFGVTNGFTNGTLNTPFLGNSSFLASCSGGFTGSLLKFSRPLKRLSFQQVR